MGEPQLPYVEIFTDGACEPNPGVGGWTFILTHPKTGSRKEFSGGDLKATNNKMEVTAALKALAQLKFPCRVLIISDSQYLVYGINEWLANWIRTGRLYDKPSCKMPNADLWWQMNKFTKIHTITGKWVRGHSGNKENERCDQLALLEIQKIAPSRTTEAKTTPF